MGGRSTRVELEWPQAQEVSQRPKTPQPRGRGARRPFPDCPSAAMVRYKDDGQRVIEDVVAPAQRRRTTSPFPWTPELSFSRSRIRPRDDGAHRACACWLPARETARPQQPQVGGGCDWILMLAFANLLYRPRGWSLREMLK